jgi:hypothetical protein
MARKTLFTFAMLLLICGSASATTYYVDATDGDDSKSGTSEANAWQNLSKVNGITFSAGDIIKFQCGEAWSGQLWPKGSGTSGSVITIDQYGDPNNGAPIINGGGAALGAVYLYNQEYWEISDLAITNYGTWGSPWRGVWIRGEDVNLTGANTIDHIYLKDLEIYNVDGNEDRNCGGIFIGVEGSNNPIRYNDLLIDSCYIHDVNRIGIRFMEQIAFRHRTIDDDANWAGWTNVVIKNNTWYTFHGTNRLSPSYY